MMDEPIVPPNASKLSQHLAALREARRDRQATRRPTAARRKSLAPGARSIIRSKTDGKCHICGGEVGTRWEADHVLSHNAGGLHSVDNYLAAHALCNNYRWDYSPEEFQWILKIGVWARSQMEKRSSLGSEMVQGFFNHEVQRQKRRRGSH